MRPVFLLSPDMQHIRNWAREQRVDLAEHDNIRWARSVNQTREQPRDGFFVVLDWHPGAGRIVKSLTDRGYEKLPDDINEWPLDLFA